MNPHFVVRNSSLLLLNSSCQNCESKGRQAKTFEALPGQNCQEGVAIALPNRNRAPDEGIAAIESKKWEKIEPNHAITKVQLRCDEEGGSMSLSFSLNDGTDLNIFNSSDETSGSNNSDDESTGVFRIARAAYSHLLHFARLTNQEIRFPSNHGEIDKEQSNPSASQFISIDSKYVDALLSSTVAVTITVGTEVVRNARINDGIPFSVILGMVRSVQKEIPAARPDAGCLNLSQFLAFFCLLEQHIAMERDAPPRLSVRVLETSNTSVRFVVSSSNKACKVIATVANPKTNTDDGKSFQLQASVAIEKAKEGIVELNGLAENTEHDIEILGRCPLSHKCARTRLIIKTKPVSALEPMTYPSWDDMSPEDQETELLAVVKDRAIRNLAAKEGLSTELLSVDSTSTIEGDELQVDICSTFALWWSQNDRAREEFCLREARHASKDPAIREAAEKEGIAIKSRDWESSAATDAAALRRRKRFCWWYYETDETKRDSALTIEAMRPKLVDAAESAASSEKAAVSQSSFAFLPPAMPFGQQATMSVKPPKQSLPQSAKAYYREPKHSDDDLPLDNGFVVVNVSDSKSGLLDDCGPVTKGPTQRHSESDEEHRSETQCIPDTADPDNNTKDGGKHSNVGHVKSPTVPQKKLDFVEQPANSTGGDGTEKVNTSPSLPGALDVGNRNSNDDANAKSNQAEGNVGQVQTTASSIGSEAKDLTAMRKPPDIGRVNRNRRSTFLGAQTAKTQKAVSEVDKMLSFQRKAKTLRGIALLKARVRLMMITARLQTLREKSGCGNSASAADHVDLFDDDNIEQPSSSHDGSPLSMEGLQKPKEAGRDIENKPEADDSPPPTCGPRKQESGNKNNAKARSFALSNVANIHKRTAARSVLGAYQAWKFYANEQTRFERAVEAETDRVEAIQGEDDKSACGSFVDDNSAGEHSPPSVMSNSVENDVNGDGGEPPESSHIVDAVSSLPSTKPSRPQPTENSAPTPACSSQYSAEEQIDKRSDTTGALIDKEKDDDAELPTRRRYRISEDLGAESMITDCTTASDYMAQNAKMLQLLSAMAYSKGCGANISRQEYDTEYSGFVERRTPLPSQFDPFTAPE